MNVGTVIIESRLEGRAFGDSRLRPHSEEDMITLEDIMWA